MNNFFKSLRENWVIIVFVGSCIFSVTMFSSRLASAEDKIKKFEETQQQITQIQIDIAVIKEKTSNENIKTQVKQGVAEALQTYDISN